MGVTNYDNLPHNIAQSRLKEARQVAAERKGSPQRVAGANLRYFRTDSAGTFLWSGQLSTQNIQDGTRGLARFYVILTSATAPVFLSSVVAEAFQSSDSGVTWTSLPLIGSPFQPADLQISPLSSSLVAPRLAIWEVFFQGPYNAYRAFKIQALTTDVVSISVDRKL